MAANQGSIKEATTDYFSSLMSGDATPHAGDMLEVILHAISLADNDSLIQVPLYDEVLTSVKGLPPDEALDPDGFPALSIFRGRTIPRAFTATLICLIPKTLAPKKFSDFRPISLCNCVYKIFSMLIDDRLSRFLPKIVSIEQGAFVQGRSIAEHCALTQEVFRDIDRKARGGNILIKLDMEKAYDRLDWGFLKAVLRCFGFRETWIAQVEKCWSNSWSQFMSTGNLAASSVRLEVFARETPSHQGSSS
ncbi:uncharacterized protein LOC131232350 [Magnolia sinica]|uniref:uncharacterized protein LOC131232350 n=1 Tax=Magnolia sinica TaxID=86752 RepID=UPI00265A8783|nr:uncharacterized protein LOC131232350 [Magnolia sinica]